jgi:hypothetical protein
MPAAVMVAGDAKGGGAEKTLLATPRELTGLAFART